MNKINLYLILFFTFTGIYTIQPSASLNWTAITQAMQSAQSALGNFTSAQNESATSFMMDQQNSSVGQADGCIRSIYVQIRAIMDLYNQRTTSTDPEFSHDGPCTPIAGEPGACSMARLPNPISDVANQFGGSLQLFYQAIQGSNNTILPAAQYNNQALQSLAGCFGTFANSLAGLSVTMTNDINNDNTSINNNTSVDPSSNPLNSDILKCQLLQDLAFVCNNIFIYLANYLHNTLNLATMLYTPEISCSDNIATTVFAVLNTPAGTAQDSLLSNLLSSNISTSIPTTPTTIPITQTTIYAAVCGFVNSYDANSTSGPYQPIIDAIINANNAVQSL